MVVSYVKKMKKTRVEQKNQFASYPISAFKYYVLSLSGSVKNIVKEEFEFNRDDIYLKKGLKVSLELLHESTLFLFKSKTEELKYFLLAEKLFIQQLGIVCLMLEIVFFVLLLKNKIDH